MTMRMVKGMEVPATMREVGRLKASPLMRFGRNQRRAALVAPGAGQKKGVVRFRTWDEVALWEKNRRTN